MTEQTFVWQHQGDIQAYDQNMPLASMVPIFGCNIWPPRLSPASGVLRGCASHPFETQSGGHPRFPAARPILAGRWGTPTNPWSNAIEHLRREDANPWTVQLPILPASLTLHVPALRRGSGQTPSELSLPPSVPSTSHLRPK